jgi:lipopolysaccharide transport system permease protein
MSRYNYAQGRNEAARFINLLRALVSRDIRARYRRSLLGPTWAILQPLMLMVVFTLLRGVLDVESGDIPYVIFSYSALMPWTFFANSVSRAGPSILGNANIIKKIRVSRELFPVVAITTAAFDAAMAGMVMAGFMVWYKVPVNLNLLWLLPLTFLTAIFAMGIGMFFAALGVYRRDFLQVNGFVLQLWLYATPIIYPIDRISDKWRDLYQLNPMVGILEGFRDVLARGQSPDLGLLLWGLPVIVLVLLISVPLFRYASRYFADVL